MPFRQPTSAVIRYFHFWGNAYEFPVESVLRSKQGDGQLHIEASPGYGLTTVGNSTPQSRQTLSYVSQSDGSWLAQGRLTLVATGPSLINGTVTLRDSIGETTSLIVRIEPVLFVDGSTVTFDQTQANEVEFTLLKIRQQGAVTPIFLAIHDSNQFALATSAQESDFVSNLTINTSFGGTYIYIRYAPNQSGRHVARLVITTPYDTKTVSLEGQASSVSAWYRLLGWSSLPTPWRVSSNQPTASPVRRWVLLALLLMAGLVYAGYTYRCQLAPSLCQYQTVVKTNTPTRERILVKAKVVTAAAIKETLAAYSTQKTRIDELRLARQSENEAIPRLVEKVNTTEGVKGGSRLKTLQRRKFKRDRLTQTKSIKPIKMEQQSDLEKELNRKPTYKR